MGYFSNSTEGEIYREKYCENCENEDEKTGCYIWWLHLSFNAIPKWKQTLDALIPHEEPGVGLNADGKWLNGNGPCVMFRQTGT